MTSRFKGNEVDKILILERNDTLPVRQNPNTKKTASWNHEQQLKIVSVLLHELLNREADGRTA